MRKLNLKDEHFIKLSISFILISVYINKFMFIKTYLLFKQNKLKIFIKTSSEYFIYLSEDNQTIFHLL